MAVSFGLVSGAIVSPPAGASAGSVADVALDGLVALESEVFALVELKAFVEPVPTHLREIADEWRANAGANERRELIDWLQQSENDGAKALDQLVATATVSDDVRSTLGRLSEGSIRSIESGGRIGLPAAAYEHALNDLEFRDGNAPPPGGTPTQRTQQTPSGVVVQPQVASPGGVATQPKTQQPTAPQPTTPQPTTQQPGRTQPTGTAPASGAAEPSGSDNGGSSVVLWAVGFALFLALGAIAGLIVGSRRRAVVGSLRTDDSVEHLFDASRRFGSSIDREEILSILTEEAKELTGSDGAAIVVESSDNAGSHVVASEMPLGLIDPTRLGRGLLRRVLDTGAAVRSVSNDPAVNGETLAVLAVPFVRSGAISGAVVVIRDASNPYGGDEADLLTSLVPMAAAALVAADRHGDVTELSLTDGLTELGNRRRLDRDLAAALGAGVGTVGFVMVDIDHFKHYNDSNGHVAGDDALRRVAHVLRDNVRDRDVVYRYGGEEFCVLLADASPAETLEVSERLRQSVEATDFDGGAGQPGGRLTISVGMTVATRSNPGDIKERADHALYEAKHRGRNQVVVDPATD